MLEYHIVLFIYFQWDSGDCFVNSKTTLPVLKEWRGRWGGRCPALGRSSACPGLPSGTSRPARTFCPPHPGRRRALGGSKSCLDWDLWWWPPAWSCRFRCRRWCRWPERCPCPSPRLWSCSRRGAPPARWGPRTSRSPWWWRGWSRRPGQRWEVSEALAWKFSRKIFHSQGRGLETSKHQEREIFSHCEPTCWVVSHHPDIVVFIGEQSDDESLALGASAQHILRLLHLQGGVVLVVFLHPVLDTMSDQFTANLKTQKYLFDMFVSRYSYLSKSSFIN